MNRRRLGLTALLAPLAAKAPLAPPTRTDETWYEIDPRDVAGLEKSFNFKRGAGDDSERTFIGTWMKIPVYVSWTYDEL